MTKWVQKEGHDISDVNKSRSLRPMILSLHNLLKRFLDRFIHDLLTTFEIDHIRLLILLRPTLYLLFRMFRMKTNFKFLLLFIVTVYKLA